MNLIDLLIILVILLSVFSGYSRGFIHGAINLILLALALFFAFRTYKYVAEFFGDHAPTIGIWTIPLAFIASWFVAWAILSTLAAALVRSIPAEVQANMLNKLLGVVPGFVYGLINAAVLSTLLLATPLFDSLSEQTRQSRLASRLTPQLEWVEEKLAPVFDEAINHSINSLTVRPESGESVQLPFSAKDPKVREDLEARMLIMVNEERMKAGLPALAPDPAIQQVARAHSRDMFARSYFAHNSPEGKTVADRARQAGVRFLTVGENLALAPTLKMAHTGLMKSPGHRANILRKTYGRVGIGILDGGRYGIMVTQNFRN